MAHRFGIRSLEFELFHHEPCLRFGAFDENSSVLLNFNMNVHYLLLSTSCKAHYVQGLHLNILSVESAWIVRKIDPGEQALV